MALKAECLLYALSLGILCRLGLILAQQQQSLDVKFDEPSVKYVKLGTATSLSCYIYGAIQDLEKVRRSIQIVKFLDGVEEVLAEGENVVSDGNYKIYLKPLPFPPSKFHVLFSILSAQIIDDRQFICRFNDLDGEVHKDTVRLHVIKTPDKLICRKKILSSTLQVTCSAVVYPQGKCHVFSVNDGNLLSSSIEYDHSQDADKLFITTCSIEVYKSYNFKITFAPDVPNPKNFTIYSNSISANPSVGFFYSFTANGEYYSVQVDSDDDLEFSCQARGNMPTQIYLFKQKSSSGSMKLLASGSSTERLEFEIDRVTLDDEGLYTCQVGYDAVSSKSITVKVKAGGSDDPDDNEGYNFSRNIIIIIISLSIGGLVMIVSVVVCTIFWVRRRRKARRARAGNGGQVLSMPTAPVPDDVFGRCNQYETTCFQMSPPPYAIACNKDDMYEVLPPPYPDVVLSSGSQAVVNSSQGTHLGSPPPYSLK
ncbi:hypothetical protein Btru_071542 [Bulinus truncatus]|nr:hypothetical protein Btru_071542 [Bulinus truncatus]